MLHPLPFTTFGEIAALGLKATVYCSACYEHRPIDPAEHLRDRCFATTRFRCIKIRYTGNVCGCLGSVEIEPAVLLPVGGEDTLAFLFCRTCLPSWEINYVPIDSPPWSVELVPPRTSLQRRFHQGWVNGRKLSRGKNGAQPPPQAVGPARVASSS
jgi:hypothetical protein